MNEYQKFIKQWAEFYNKGFPIFVAIFATIFVNIYTQNIQITIADAFSKIITLAFAIYALSVLLISIFVAGIFWFFMVIVLGTIIFLIQKMSYWIHDKAGMRGTIILYILSLVVIGAGFWFSFPQQSLNMKLLGYSLVFIGLVPWSYGVINTIKRKEFVPYYIG